MPKKLILHGRVQGVFCRRYCSQYAKKLGIAGTASNLSDGTVQVLLKTDDEELVYRYIDMLKSNPGGFMFYGRIIDIDLSDYNGAVYGDYVF